jgi:capsular exopolysaccharide synthesis family protein
MDRKQRSDEIDLLVLFRDIMKNWWLVLVAAVAFALLTNVVVTATYQPEYTTETILVVTTTDLNSTVERNLSSTKTLAACFAEVLDSSVLRAKVAEDLGVSEVKATTEVEQIEETNMVELRVTAATQVEAFRVTNSMLANYSQITDYVLEDVITEVLQAPVIPTNPSNEPDMTKDMAIGFLLGAVVMMAYLAVCSMLHDTVKNEKQAEEKLDARFLGAVYHEKKKGSGLGRKGSKADAMLLDNPLRSFRFAEANKMLAARVSSRMDRDGKKVLMVTSVLENEGKSTVAANLALALARENKRVLLVDLDLRKPAQYKILSLTGNQRFDLAKALQDGVAPADMAVSYRQTRLSVIAGGVMTLNTDAFLSNPRLKELLDYWKDYVDYIVLDTAPLALTSDTEDMVQLADATALVVRTDFVLASAVNNAIDRLESAGGTVLGCILNDATKPASIGSDRSTL